MKCARSARPGHRGDRSARGTCGARSTPWSSEMAKRVDTRIVHGAGDPAKPTRDIAPPIYVSTTYERGADGSYPGGRVYSRADNPTYDAPEALIAALEDAKAALVFSSGQAAA